MKQKPEARGNRAKIDPAKKIIGENVTNAVTLSSRKTKGVPVVDDESVALAKAFSEENQK